MATPAPSGRALDTLKTVAAVASTADDVEAAFREVLEVACTYLGWPAGRATTGEQQPAGPPAVDVWHRAPEVAEVPPDRLASALVVPIRSSRGDEGVLELFTTEPCSPTPEAADLVRHLATLLGNVVEREAAAWRQDAHEASLERTNAVLLHHRRVLEGIGLGAPVGATLRLLCEQAERDQPGIRCSVMTVDPVHQTLHVASAPSLPPAVADALDGMAMHAGNGACGAAATWGRAVVVEDVLDDPITAPFVWLAEEHGLRAVWSHPLVTAVGEVIGTFAVYRDHPHRPTPDEVEAITGAGHLAAVAIERARSVAALAAAAEVDPLTELPNRARFLELVGEHLRQGPIAVLFLDIDRFKWINDSLGHPTGDVVLGEVARRLRRVLEPVDVVARFGGDEFTILLRDPSPEAIDRAAAGVRTAFAHPFAVRSGGEFVLSASIGVATSQPGSTASDLVRDADTAMYAAKARGGAGHAMFDEHLRNAAVDRIALERSLHLALERREFRLHYQPVFDVARGRWSGAEALVRWEHPERGLLHPEAFLPLTEETGLIVPLGEHLLDLAAEQIAAWAAAGTPTHVAVNVSVVQLLDPAIAERVANVLDRHALDPELLFLEITESTIMEHVAGVTARLSAIAALGVRLVIDDFGTGHSSIARVSELPVVTAKVDRRFTRDLGVNPRAQHVLRAIVDLCHALGLRVVAEGIETQAAFDLAGAVGCDALQGYFLSRPVPPEQVREVLDGPVPVASIVL